MGKNGGVKVVMTPRKLRRIVSDSESEHDNSDNWILDSCLDSVSSPPDHEQKDDDNFPSFQPSSPSSSRDIAKEERGYESLATPVVRHRAYKDSNGSPTRLGRSYYVGSFSRSSNNTSPNFNRKPKRKRSLPPSESFGSSPKHKWRRRARTPCEIFKEKLSRRRRSRFAFSLVNSHERHSTKTLSLSSKKTGLPSITIRTDKDSQSIDLSLSFARTKKEGRSSRLSLTPGPSPSLVVPTQKCSRPGCATQISVDEPLGSQCETCKLKKPFRIVRRKEARQRKETSGPTPIVSKYFSPSTRAVTVFSSSDDEGEDSEDETPLSKLFLASSEAKSSSPKATALSDASTLFDHDNNVDLQTVETSHRVIKFHSTTSPCALAEDDSETEVPETPEKPKSSSSVQHLTPLSSISPKPKSHILKSALKNTSNRFSSPEIPFWAGDNDLNGSRSGHGMITVRRSVSFAPEIEQYSDVGEGVREVEVVGEDDEEPSSIQKVEHSSAQATEGEHEEESCTLIGRNKVQEKKDTKNRGKKGKGKKVDKGKGKMRAEDYAIEEEEHIGQDHTVELARLELDPQQQQNEENVELFKEAVARTTQNSIREQHRTTMNGLLIPLSVGEPSSSSRSTRSLSRINSDPTISSPPSLNPNSHSSTTNPNYLPRSTTPSLQGGYRSSSRAPSLLHESYNSKFDNNNTFNNKNIHPPPTVMSHTTFIHTDPNEEYQNLSSLCQSLKSIFRSERLKKLELEDSKNSTPLVSSRSPQPISTTPSLRSHGFGLINFRGYYRFIFDTMSSRGFPVDCVYAQLLAKEIQSKLGGSSLRFGIYPPISTRSKMTSRIAEFPCECQSQSRASHSSPEPPITTYPYSSTTTDSEPNASHHIIGKICGGTVRIEVNGSWLEDFDNLPVCKVTVEVIHPTRTGPTEEKVEDVREDDERISEQVRLTLVEGKPEVRRKYGRNGTRRC
ncbi:hypothetical protein C8Q75DRAFT_890669 [Abortiporus biennis]|nr:hypothetical protein C8Q75DRAFT_890669 [Abortiporus biennis]